MSMSQIESAAMLFSKADRIRDRMAKNLQRFCALTEWRREQPAATTANELIDDCACVLAEDLALLIDGESGL